MLNMWPSDWYNTTTLILSEIRPQGPRGRDQATKCWLCECEALSLVINNPIKTLSAVGWWMVLGR